VFDKITNNLIFNIWFAFVDHARNKIDIINPSKERTTYKQTQYCWNIINKNLLRKILTTQEHRCGEKNLIARSNSRAFN
jgi:hypothetical protein